MVENVDSLMYVLIKTDITFCTSGFEVGKSASEIELQKLPKPAQVAAQSGIWRMLFVCISIISLSKVELLSR